MEALTAVSVAALTLYDMLKAVDPAARIEGIAGGAQGGRQDRRLVAAVTIARREPTAMTPRPASSSPRPARRQGVRGPHRSRHRRLADPARLSTRRPGRRCPTASTLQPRRCSPRSARSVDVILTSGGTGISPTDGTAGRDGQHRRLPDPRARRRHPAVRPAARADVGAVPRRVRRAGRHPDRQPARLVGGRQGRSRGARRRTRARAGPTPRKDHTR